MSKARTEFSSRINTLRSSMVEPVLIDGAPSERKKNEVACMFRNGLAVLTFATLEDFVRTRTAEVLSSINNAIKFSDLSEKLQLAATLGALKAILFRQNFEDDPVAWTLAQLAPVANAATNVSLLSPLSFGQQKSNVSTEDISNILNAFGVQGGWSAITAVAKRIGVGGATNYSQSFENIAARRHKAAHDITANIPLSDLENSVTEIIGICCSFDLLLSHSLSLHNLKKIPNKAVGLVKQEDISLRFISMHPTKLGRFREQVEGRANTGLHTTRTHSSLTDAETAALTNCRAKCQQLVYLDSKGLPSSWNTWQ